MKQVLLESNNEEDLKLLIHLADRLNVRHSAYLPTSNLSDEHYTHLRQSILDYSGQQTSSFNGFRVAAANARGSPPSLARLMKLIDSNILIYSYQDQYTYLRPLASDRTNYVSAISHLEVLGFHTLAENERAYFEMVFAVLVRLPVRDNIIDMAIRLRQQHKMKSNDSLIAASELVYGLELYTRNVSDFSRVAGLKLFNPVL